MDRRGYRFFYSDCCVSPASLENSLCSLKDLSVRAQMAAFLPALEIACLISLVPCQPRAGEGEGDRAAAASRLRGSCGASLAPSLPAGTALGRTGRTKTCHGLVERWLEDPSHPLRLSWTSCFSPLPYQNSTQGGSVPALTSLTAFSCFQPCANAVSLWFEFNS